MTSESMRAAYFGWEKMGFFHSRWVIERINTQRVGSAKVFFRFLFSLVLEP